MVNYIQGVQALDLGTGLIGILGDTDTYPGRRIRDVSNKIWEVDPNNAPLTTLLRNLRKLKVTDPKFEWFEDEYPQQWTLATDADTSSADTTIGVTTGEGKLGRPFDLWMNADSGETVMIMSVSTDTWTVIRGVGAAWSGVGPSPIDTGDKFFYIGNAQQTGSSARDKLSTQTVPKYNYVQIFKEGFEITRTATNTGLYGGPQRKYRRHYHANVHNRDIEKGFWFGVRDDLDTSDDAASVITTMSYTTGGVFGWLSTNEKENFSGSLSEDEFEIFLEDAFRYGNRTKWMFSAPRVCTVIDSWGRGKLDLIPRDTAYGIAISKYISSHGELNIIMNKVFQDMGYTSAAVTPSGAPYDYSKCSVILDLENLGYRYMEDTVLQTDIQENDKDTVEDQYRTQCGLFLANEKWHTEIHGWALS